MQLATKARFEELQAKIGRSEQELDELITSREKELKDFEAEKSELAAVCKTFGAVMATVVEELITNWRAYAPIVGTRTDAIVQALEFFTETAILSEEDKNRLTGFVQQQQQDDEVELDWWGTSSKADGVLKLLDDLKEKADSKLRNLCRVEQKAADSFDGLKRSLTASLNADIGAAGQGQGRQLVDDVEILVTADGYVVKQGEQTLAVSSSDLGRMSALRIARLCLEHCEEGATWDKVMFMRDEMYRVAIGKKARTV